MTDFLIGLAIGGMGAFALAAFFAIVWAIIWMWSR